MARRARGADREAPRSGLHGAQQHRHEDAKVPSAPRGGILVVYREEPEEEADQNRRAHLDVPVGLTQEREDARPGDLAHPRAVLHAGSISGQAARSVLFDRGVHHLLVHERVGGRVHAALDVVDVERGVHLVERRVDARGVELAAERVHRDGGGPERLDGRRAVGDRNAVRHEQP